MRRIAGVLIALVVLLALAVPAGAREIIQGDECRVEADEVVAGNLFVLCRSLVIAGTIDGSLFGIAFDVDVTGTVRNDIYLAAGQLDVTGTIGEDLLFGGIVMRVAPEATFLNPRGDVVSAGLSTEIDAETVIPDSLTVAGYQLLLDGAVTDEVNFWGAALVIGGAVRGDVNAAVGDPEAGDADQLATLLIPFRFDIQLANPGLVVQPDASIDGLLQYRSAAEGQIEGELAREPVYTPIVTRPDLTQPILVEEENVAWLSTYLGQAVNEFITLLVIGIICLTLAPRPVQAPLHNLRVRPLTSLGVGLMVFILSFAAVIVLLVLGLLLLFALAALGLGDLMLAALMLLTVVSIGGAGTFYLVAVFVARVIASLGLGRTLVWITVGDDGSLRLVYLGLVVGVALLALVAWLPLIGWLVNFVALALGLGAIILTIIHSFSRSGPVPQPVQLPSTIEAGRAIPPPAIEDVTDEPGLSNLPEGFDWWGEDQDSKRD